MNGVVIVIPVPSVIANYYMNALEKKTLKSASNKLIILYREMEDTFAI